MSGIIREGLMKFYHMAQRGEVMLMAFNYRSRVRS